jgi:hypothetical protein
MRLDEGDDAGTPGGGPACSAARRGLRPGGWVASVAASGLIAGGAEAASPTLGGSALDFGG